MQSAEVKPEPTEKGYDLKPGIYPDINEADYHQSPGISKHGLDLIYQSPAHYRANIMNESRHLIYGGALHALVLEPARFSEKYVVSEFAEFRTKAAKAWRDEQRALGLRVVYQDDFEVIQIIRDKIMEHPTASQIIQSDHGRAELSAYWVDKDRNIWKREKPTHCLCRCRPDFINDQLSVVVDLKTTRCAGFSAFARDVARYRYHVQDAFYTDGLRQLGLRVDSFIFLAVEKEPPYAIGLYELDKDDRELGRQLYQRDLIHYRKCLTEKAWPSYPEEVRILQLPRWSRTIDFY